MISISRTSKFLLLAVILCSSLDLSSRCRRPRRIRALKLRCAQIRRLQARIARIRSLTVTTNAQINGNLQVDGTLTTNGAITASNVAVNFLNAQKLTTQSITASFANITPFSIIKSNGWTFNGTDTFTVPATGTYKIDYVAHVSATALDNIAIRVLANGSQIDASVTANSVATPSYTETLSHTFMADLTAGQTITLQVSTSSIIPSPTLAATTVSGALAPSVSLSITQVQ